MENRFLNLANDSVIQVNGVEVTRLVLPLRPSQRHFDFRRQGSIEVLRVSYEVHHPPEKASLELIVLPLADAALTRLDAMLNRLLGPT